MVERRLDEVTRTVRESYGKIARGEVFGCGCGSGCGDPTEQLRQYAAELGYTAEELAALPEGANLGLGCGNPRVLAGFQLGETVLDLGSGAGVDCLVAAREVGTSGRVIGVDMTPDMLHLARQNVVKAGTSNVEFRLGEIENLPVADGEVDVIISNCVINLSPHKQRVYAEMLRVLKPGGRLAISDIVALRELPEEMQRDLTMVAACVGGAQQVGGIESVLQELGFTDIRVEPMDSARETIATWFPDRGIEDYVASASITARKPETSCCG